jgi:hypothetical protein
VSASARDGDSPVSASASGSTRWRGAAIAAGWIVLAALMASYAYVFFVPGGLDHAWSQWVAQLGYLVPHLTTVVLCFTLFLRLPAGRERRFWAYLGFSSLLLLAYESLFAYWPGSAKAGGVFRRAQCSR